MATREFDQIVGLPGWESRSEEEVMWDVLSRVQKRMLREAAELHGVSLDTMLQRAVEQFHVRASSVQQECSAVLVGALLDEELCAQLFPLVEKKMQGVE